MSGFPCKKTRNILILGTGYLGKALAESLRKDTALTVLTADIVPNSAIYHADVTEAEAMFSLASRIPTPHIIVMCVSTCGGSEDAYRRLYIHGLQNVLDAFPRVPIIFCSSTSVYGIKDGRWVTEEHNIYPQTGKTALLAEAEHLVLSTAGIVVRLGALYGPNRCALATRYCTDGLALPGDKNRWLNYIHRDDAVTALHLLCTLQPSPSGIFNLTDRTPMQMEDIYSYLSNLLDLPMPHLGPLPAESKRGFTNQRISCSRLLSMGWEPLYPSFVDGVHNVLEAMEE